MIAETTFGFSAPAPHPFWDRDPPARAEAIADYLRSGLATIDGWGIDPFLAQVFLSVDRFQQLNGDRGNLFEIGVHHGRAAILLALMARDLEHTVMIDLFDRQDENIDNSGCGSREILEKNLATWAKGRPVEIVKANSLELDFADVSGLRAGVRFAHIDGGHYREVVLNDLKKTEAVLVDGGVVVMDDFEHAGFPEVNQACNEYLEAGDTRLAPVAMGYNKLILTTRDNQARLAGFLSQYGTNHALFGDGEAGFQGYDVVRLVRW